MNIGDRVLLCNNGTILHAGVIKDFKDKKYLFEAPTFTDWIAINDDFLHLRKAYDDKEYNYLHSYFLSRQLYLFMKALQFDEILYRDMILQKKINELYIYFNDLGF